MVLTSTVCATPLFAPAGLSSLATTSTLSTSTYTSPISLPLAVVTVYWKLAIPVKAAFGVKIIFVPLTVAVPCAATGAVEIVSVGEATLLSFAKTLIVLAAFEGVFTSSVRANGARAGIGIHAPSVANVKYCSSDNALFTSQLLPTKVIGTAVAPALKSPSASINRYTVVISAGKPEALVLSGTLIFLEVPAEKFSCILHVRSKICLFAGAPVVVQAVTDPPSSPHIEYLRLVPGASGCNALVLAMVLLKPIVTCKPELEDFACF